MSKRPSVACCAKSATKAAYQVVTSKVLKKKPILVPIKVRDERLSICESNVCEKYDNGTCTECGCVLKIKAFLTVMKCPLDHW